MSRDGSLRTSRSACRQQTVHCRLLSEHKVVLAFTCLSDSCCSVMQAAVIAQQQQQHAQQHEYPTSSMPPDMHNGGVQTSCLSWKFATIM